MTLRIVPSPISSTVTIEVVGEKELVLAYDDERYEKGGAGEKWAKQLGGITKEQYDFVRFNATYWKFWLVTWKTTSQTNPFPASVHVPYQGVYITLTNIRRTTECIAFAKIKSFKFDGAASYFDPVSRHEITLGCHFLPERTCGELTEYRVLVCLFDPTLTQLLLKVGGVLVRKALRRLLGP